VIVAVAGVTPIAPAARARAIDQDQPTAKRTSIATDIAVKMRSALPIRRSPRTLISGKASSQSPGVALRRGGGELARLSSILAL